MSLVDIVPGLSASEWGRMGGRLRGGVGSLQKSILRLADEALQVGDRRGLGQLLSRRLHELLGGDSASYNEFPAHGEPILIRDQGFIIPDGQAIFARHYLQHPIVMHHKLTRDRRAHRFSDFLSRRALERLPLYNEYYRPSAIAHQLSISIYNTDRAYVALAVNRGTGSDFPLRDRHLLTALGPLLTRAYENAVALEHLRAETLALRGGVTALRRGIVILAPDSTILAATPLAEAWLQRYLNWRGTPRLPSPLDAWVTQAAPGDATSIALGQYSLNAVFAKGERGDVMLLLRELPDGPEALPHGALGLTPREVEVLAWISRGKTDGDIAVILDLSVRTVQHHVGHVLAKLGVESRTAAAAAVYQASREADDPRMGKITYRPSPPLR